MSNTVQAQLILRFPHKSRTYLHFDEPLSEIQARELSTNPEAVASHSFLPFLGFSMKTKRYRKEEGVRHVSVKERPIRYASHKDAAIYAWYSHRLSEKYEDELSLRGLKDVVSAFRSDQGTNIHIARDVFQFVRANRPCVTLALDIEGFFDNLDHAVLKRAWCHLLGETNLPDDHYAVYRSLTRYCWVDVKQARKAVELRRKPLRKGPPRQRRHRLCSAQEFRTQIRDRGLLRFGNRERKGIPQGSPISAMLSNLYMLEFDTVVHRAVEAVGGMYRRYCDDIMIVVPAENLADIEALIADQLNDLQLTSHPDKREEVQFPTSGKVSGKPLPYLGFIFDGETIRLRDASLNRYYGKMRRAVRLAQATQRKANTKETAAGNPLSQLKTTKLYRRYSYLATRRTRKPKQPHGNKNYITYAHRAARIMDSDAIRKQVRPHWRKLQSAIRIAQGGRA